MTIPPVLRWPLLLVVPTFLLLCALGGWQLQRLAWKTDLIARIDAGAAGPAEPFPARVVDARALEYRKLVARGTFDHARTVFYGAIVRGREGGSFVVTPLLREGAQPILVLRGWVREGRQDFPRPEGEVAVTGFAFAGSSGNWFTPDPDPRTRRFYAFDIPRIAAAIDLADVASVGLVALGPRDAVPLPEQALPRPTNPHLGYAITWFGLAGALLAFFVVWARSLLREQEHAP
ncbi:MAG: SURF1 family protein [Acetobacteraceae bacterium]|nr:SURF1 family protein [Acetobacteraceae bacterium]